MISRHPPGLEPVVGGKSIGQSFQDLPAENCSSNFAEVHNLLVDCFAAFKQHLFPRLIELCGTSDALLALVATHSEDDL